MANIMKETLPLEREDPAPAPDPRSHPASPLVRPMPARPGSRLRLAFRFSTALVVVAAIASTVGVFHVGIFHDVAITAGNAQGTDLVVLAIAVPTVVISMILTARGSLRAQITWLGGLAYILYNSIFFAYGTHFNQLFLVYAATLALAFWSVVTLLRVIDAKALSAAFKTDTPVRIIAGYLLVTTALFTLTWLKDIVPAVINNAPPGSLKGTGMVTNLIEMTDLAFGFPLTGLSALWLWQRRPWGYPLAGAFLVYGVIEALSIASDQFFMHVQDPSSSAAAVPVFLVLALIGLVPTVAYLHHLRDPHL